MKKLLAIILAGLMVFSAMGVFAEETTEETTLSSGTMTNAAGEAVREFFTDYSTAITNSGSYAFSDGDFSGNARYSGGASADGANRRSPYELSSVLMPWKDDANNSYLNLKYPYPAATMVSGAAFASPAFLYQLKFSNIAVGDKIHISVDAKTNDSIFRKDILFAAKANTYGSGAQLRLVSFMPSGELAFYNSDEAIPYSINLWYHFDIIVSFDSITTDDTGAITASSCTVDYYVDGENIDTVSSVTNFFDTKPYFGYAMQATDDTERNADSILSADNLSVKMLSESVTPTINKRKSAVYTDFSKYTSAHIENDTDEEVASASASSSLVNYTKVQGAFGKATDDDSLKISVIDDYAYDAEYKQVHFMVESANSVGKASYIDGERFKISISMANSIDVKPSVNKNYAYVRFGTTNLMRLYPGGNVYIDKTDTGFKAEAGKWYTYTVVGTFNETDDGTKTLDFDLYVNGELIGSKENISAAYRIAQYRIGLRSYGDVVGDDGNSYAHPYEVYYDDVTVESYPLSVDTVEIATNDAYAVLNGTIALNDSVKDTYTVADFAAANPDESFTVLDNGVAVTDTTATLMGKVVVFNENNWQPIYYYVEPEFEYTLTTPDYATGTYTAIADVINNVDKTVRLVVATYNSDNELTNIKISSIYSINAVIKASVDVAETDSKIKVFLLDDIDTIVPYGSAVEVTPAA